MEYRLTAPMTREQARQLRCGDTVLFTGTIYTARDAAHKRLVELLDKGEPLPFDVNGAVIYYAGPTPAQKGHAVGSCGPTTSYRMDAYAPKVIAAGSTFNRRLSKYLSRAVSKTVPEPMTRWIG